MQNNAASTARSGETCVSTTHGSASGETSTPIREPFYSISTYYEQQTARSQFNAAGPMANSGRGTILRSAERGALIVGGTPGPRGEPVPYFQPPVPLTDQSGATSYFPSHVPPLFEPQHQIQTPSMTLHSNASTQQPSTTCRTFGSRPPDSDVAPPRNVPRPAYDVPLTDMDLPTSNRPPDQNEITITLSQRAKSGLGSASTAGSTSASMAHTFTPEPKFISHYPLPSPLLNPEPDTALLYAKVNSVKVMVYKLRRDSTDPSTSSFHKGHINSDRTARLSRDHVMEAIIQQQHKGASTSYQERCQINTGFDSGDGLDCFGTVEVPLCVKVTVQSSFSTGQTPSSNEKVLKVEVSSEENPYIHYHCDITATSYAPLQSTQRLIVPFDEFPRMLVNLLNQCHHDVASTKSSSSRPSTANGVSTHQTPLWASIEPAVSKTLTTARLLSESLVNHSTTPFISASNKPRLSSVLQVFHDDPLALIETFRAAALQTNRNEAAERGRARLTDHPDPDGGLDPSQLLNRRIDTSIDSYAIKGRSPALQTAKSGFALLSVVERNEFREINHLCLNLRGADDEQIITEVCKRYRDHRLHAMHLAVELDSLQAKQLETHQRLDESKEEATGLQQQCAAIKRKLVADYEAEMKRLTDSHERQQTSQAKTADELRSMLRSVEASCASKDHDILSLREGEEGMKQEARELRRELKGVTEEKDSLKTHVSEYKSKIASNEEVIAMLRERMGNLELQLSNEVTLSSTSKERTTQLITELNMSTEKVKDFQSKLKQSAEEINKGNTIISKLQDRVNSLKSRLVDKTSQHEQHTEVIKELKNEVDRLTSSLGAAETITRDMNERDTKLMATNCELEAQLKEAKATIESNQQVIEYLNKQLTDRDVRSIMQSGGGDPLDSTLIKLAPSITQAHSSENSTALGSGNGADNLLIMALSPSSPTSVPNTRAAREESRQPATSMGVPSRQHSAERRQFGRTQSLLNRFAANVGSSSGSQQNAGGSSHQKQPIVSPGASKGVVKYSPPP
eukprot:GHVN01066952.1.p1 GENE.GHVN01066952.1~~GHVN01066952.1.p1  ORF type:complete len:1025 (-),score=140.88 GHVN01066952.1:5720-8794(-)